MAYYATPADMYEKRAENFQNSADRHWAMAKNGEGDYHYGKAKSFYAIAESNREKAEQARADGATWGK